MQKTKIDWADRSWNPVTGCLHGCNYCYAEKIAKRFGGAITISDNGFGMECQSHTRDIGTTHYMIKPMYNPDTKNVSPYPFYFDPTFHRYRLDEPAKLKNPSSIFVCSMADLFGDWVPDEWIQEVFNACEKAPQHTYLFLTKNPKRYMDLYNQKLLPYKTNYWFGTSVTTPDDEFVWFKDTPYHYFASIEPILQDFSGNIVPKSMFPEWVIIGAETGNRKGNIIPKREWIESIVEQCRQASMPVFMKESLRSIWGEELIQEFPAEWGK